MLNFNLTNARFLIAGIATTLVFTAQPSNADAVFDVLRSYYATEAHLPLGVKIENETVDEAVRRIEFSYSAFDNEVVPARLEVPRDVVNPPVVILLHGLTQSREQWWRADDGPYSFPSRHRTELIQAGYAVLAIDARGHGERLDGTDFSDPAIYLERAYFDAGRKIIAETVIDVRRAIDVLETIEGIDTDRIGVTGFSLGAFIGYLAAAVEPRIDAGLIMAMPFLPLSEGHAVSFTSQFAYVDGIGDKPMGFIVGTEDQLYTREAVEALAGAMLVEPQVTWVESGHDLPDETALTSVTFFKDAL